MMSWISVEPVFAFYLDASMLVRDLAAEAVEFVLFVVSDRSLGF